MLSSKRMGSKYNIAPEIFMNIPYDFKIDVWSATVIVFVLLCGHLPFQGKDIKEIANDIKKRNISDII